MFYWQITFTIFIATSFALGQAPPNDDRANALVLELDQLVLGTLVEATTETNEPLDGSVQRTVWYLWDAPPGAWEARVASREARVIASAYFENEDGQLTELSRTAFSEWSSPPDSQNPSVGLRFCLPEAEKIWIQVYNISAVTGDFSLQLSALAPVDPGDNFADARELPGEVSDLPLNLDLVTRELGEPPSPYQGTLWRRWILPSNGPWLISARGFASSMSLDIWSGSSLDDLTSMEFATSRRATASPSAPTPHLIIDGQAGDSVWVRIATNHVTVAELNIARPSPGDLFSQPVPLGSINETSLTFSLQDKLTIEAAEPTPPGQSRWLTWTAPHSGTFEIQGQRSGATSSIGTIQGLDPFINLFVGDDLTSLTPVTSVPFNFQNPFVRANRFRRFRAEANTTYRIQTGVTPYSGVISTNSGSGGSPSFMPTQLEIALIQFETQAPNDDFADAEHWGTSTDITSQGHNRGATNEGDEVFAQFDRGNSVWHRWTAPESAPYELRLESMEGLHFDLFSGATLENLTLMQGTRLYFNPGLKTEVVRFQAEKDESYALRITSDRTAEGDYTVALQGMSPPINDRFDNALELSGNLPLTATGTTRFASDDFPDNGNPGGLDQSDESTIWWKWTPTETGSYELQADAILGLFENGNLVGHDSTIYGGHLRFIATAGQEYHFRISHPRTSEGPVSLTLQPITGMEHLTIDTAVDLGSSVSLVTPALSVIGGPVLFDNTLTSGRAIFRWTPRASGWVRIRSRNEASLLLGVTEGDLRGQTSFRMPQSPLNDFDFSTSDSSFSFAQQRVASAPLRTNLKRQPGTVPQRVQGIMEVEAGVTYFLTATPQVQYNETAQDPTRVHLQIDRLAPPPSLILDTWKLLPERNRLQATLLLNSPNGFSHGLIRIGPLRQWFDNANRISGDAFRGEYRVVIPIGGTSEEFRFRPDLSLIDQFGASKVQDLDQVLLTADPLKTPDQQGPFLHPGSVKAQQIRLSDNDEIIELELAVIDQGSGFSHGEIHLPDAFYQTSLGQTTLPLGQHDTRVIFFDASNRIAGDSLAGLYRVNVRIPASTAPGNLILRLQDRAGNLNGSWDVQTNGSFPQYRFQSGYTLPITLIRDGVGNPVLPQIAIRGAGLSALTSSIIETSANLSHPVGISRGRVILQDGQGVIVASQNFDREDLAEGTLQEGRFDLDLALPGEIFGGEFWLRWDVIAQDGAAATMAWADPILLSPQLFGDQRRPVLTRLEVTPRQLNLEEERTVTFNLAAHDDRPNIRAIVSIFDGESRLLAQGATDCQQTFLDCETTLTLPQTDLTSRSRFARIEVILLDAAGRWVSYGQTESPSWPGDLAPQLALAEEEPDHLSQWYRQWTGQVAPPDPATRDFDRDGWPDLVEFAMGTDPATQVSCDPFASQLPALEFNGTFFSGSREYRFQTFRTQYAPWFDLNEEGQPVSDQFEISIEGSDDLLHWENIPPLPSWSPGPPPLPLLETNRQVPATQQVQAYRLRIQPITQ